MSENLENNDLLAKWLANDLTTEEKQRLEKEGNLDDLKFAVDDMATWSLKPMDVDKGLKQLKEKRVSNTPKAKVVSFNRWMSIAAAVVLLIASYIGWDFYFNNLIDISTDIAQTEEIILPDESVIKLDAQSSLSYDKRKWEENRTISLSGQAYFDVMKGSTFMVNTPTGSVTVLGTEFNVRSEEGYFMVECFEGSVLVKAGDNEKVLKPGDRVNLIQGDLLRSHHNNDSPDWTQGFSLYEQAKLSQIVSDLNKYYKIDLTLPSKYEQLEFTGKVTHNDIKKALRTVFDTMEINYSLNDDNKVVFE